MWYNWSITYGIVFQVMMVLAYFMVALLACRLVVDPLISERDG